MVTQAIKRRRINLRFKLMGLDTKIKELQKKHKKFSSELKKLNKIN